MPGFFDNFGDTLNGLASAAGNAYITQRWGQQEPRYSVNEPYMPAPQAEQAGFARAPEIAAQQESTSSSKENSVLILAGIGLLAYLALK